MPRVLDPFRFLLIAVAGWMNQPQQFAIDYLREENRVLREQLGPRLCRRILEEVAGIVTPDTLLNWHLKLIAEKSDGTAQRGPGRPRTAAAIESLVVRMANATIVDQVRIMLRRGNVQPLAAEGAVAVEQKTLASRKGPHLVSFCTPG